MKKAKGLVDDSINVIVLTITVLVPIKIWSNNRYVKDTKHKTTINQYNITNNVQNINIINDNIKNEKDIEEKD